MIHGLDTGFLVALEVREHAEHADARVTLAQLLLAGDVIAIAPQVLAEFIHVVTDPRRFTQPLDMNAARQVADQWWTASDVVQVFPTLVPCGSFSRGCSSSRWAASDCWIRFCRNLPAGGHPIAPHHQPVGLPGFRRLYLHLAHGQRHESLSLLRYGIQPLFIFVKFVKVMLQDRRVTHARS